MPTPYGYRPGKSAVEVKYRDYTFRYRLELTLEVDGKPSTSSCVIEVRWIGGPSIAQHGAHAGDGHVYG
jgi:hypothetical protein